MSLDQKAWLLKKEPEPNFCSLQKVIFWKKKKLSWAISKVFSSLKTCFYCCELKWIFPVLKTSEFGFQNGQNFQKQFWFKKWSYCPVVEVLTLLWNIWTGANWSESDKFPFREHTPILHLPGNDIEQNCKYLQNVLHIWILINIYLNRNFI